MHWRPVHWSVLSDGWTGGVTLKCNTQTSDSCSLSSVVTTLQWMHSYAMNTYCSVVLSETDDGEEWRTVGQPVSVTVTDTWHLTLTDRCLPGAGVSNEKVTKISLWQGRLGRWVSSNTWKLLLLMCSINAYIFSSWEILLLPMQSFSRVSKIK